MKQLVTGGVGFIGSNYVRYILENTDDTVIIVDALTYAGKLTTIRDVLDSNRVRFVHGDICDKEILTQEMNNCDYVVNFAAESHVDRSISASEDFVKTNCLGTDSVMDVARIVGVKKVVHIGTDEVYGSIEEVSSMETDPLEPRSPYSASKAGSDLLALAHFHTHKLPVSVTRCTNNFGPFQFPEKAIPLFITNVIRGKKIPLYGDGLNVRDWIDVVDHCSAVYSVLTRGVDGDIYNIGGGNETPNIQLVESILEHIGIEDKSEWIEYVSDRKGHDRRYSVNTEKMQGLGWRPQNDFQSSLSKTVDWYNTNKWWWEPLVRNKNEK
jgi:dTDP-glucose 4,6-dehydratase